MRLVPVQPAAWPQISPSALNVVHLPGFRGSTELVELSAVFLAVLLMGGSDMGTLREKCEVLGRSGQKASL